MQINYKEILKTKQYPIELKNIIETLYIEQGYGYKSIAKQYGISYTQCRKLLQILDIDVRTGRNIITNQLRAFRKEKALRESKNNTGFNSPYVFRKNNHISRGIQGYYYNKSQNSYCWLRSSWEYIFAKWLDKTFQKWKTEVTNFKLNGKNYRPDFFIYDDLDRLVKIIEIKGFWDNNSYKADLLNEQLDIDVIIITDISKYVPEKSSIDKERIEWKEKRILKIGQNY